MKLAWAGLSHRKVSPGSTHPPSRMLACSGRGDERTMEISARVQDGDSAAVESYLSSVERDWLVAEGTDCQETHGESGHACSVNDGVNASWSLRLR